MEESVKLILNELQKMNGRLDNLEAGQAGLVSGHRGLEVEIRALKEGQDKLRLVVMDIKNGQEKLQRNLIQS